MGLPVGGERKITVLLALFLVFALISGAVLVVNEVSTGSMQTKWTFAQSTTASSGQGNFEVLKAGPNGTVLVQEQLGAWGPLEHPRNLVFLDPQGSLLWRVGINSYYQDTVFGADGRFYYTDWLNASDWTDSSKWRLGNLTALEADGSERWRYTSPNGSLYIWGTFSDGTVIARHTDEIWDAESRNITDEMIGLSSNGALLWAHPLPTDSSHDLAYQDPNGTIVVLSHYDMKTRMEGYGKDGSMVWQTTLDQPIWFTESHWGPVYYTVTRTLAPNSSVYVSAFNTSNGSFAWKLTIEGKADSEIANASEYWGAMVDGLGNIYALNGTNHNFLVAIGQDGQLLWNRTISGYIIDSYDSGGLLVREEWSLLRLSADGSVAWRLDLDRSKHPYFNFNVVILSDDETIAIGEGEGVQAIAKADISNNVVILSVLAIAVVFVTGAYFYRRRQRRSAS